MFDRAIIHVGTPKTGTSALQRFLAANRDDLRAAGWVYLDRFGDLPKSVIGAYVAGGTPKGDAPDDADLTAVLGDLEPDRLIDRVDAAFDELAAKAEPGQTLVFSSEYLWLSGNCPDQRDRLMTLLGRVAKDVRVVAYLRRQDRYVSSRISTLFKSGRVPDANALETLVDLEDPRYWFGEQLEGWAQAVGSDRVEARIFDRSRLVAGNIIDDFAAVCGLKTDGLARTDTPANPSLAPLACAYLAAIEPLIPFHTTQGRNRDRQSLNRALEAEYPASPRWLTREQAQAFAAHFEETNKLAARWVTNGPSGAALFDDDFSDYPDQPPSLDGFGFADATGVGAALWLYSQRRDRAQRAENQYLRGQLKSQQGKPAAALKHFEQALKLHRRPPAKFTAAAVAARQQIESVSRAAGRPMAEPLGQEVRN